MSEAPQPRPWFKPRDTGTGWTPVTWQGWLITAAFCLLIVATVQLVIPEGSGALIWTVSARRALGLSTAGLGLVGAVLAIGSELGAFLVVAWWTSRPMKPFD